MSRFTARRAVIGSIFAAATLVAGTGIAHAEFALAGYAPTYYDRHVVALHFYHNLVVVEKGLNDEPSNVPAEVRQR